jgi:hypothetical protein
MLQFGSESPAAAADLLELVDFVRGSKRGIVR